ncbi:MAG: PIN domain-containing protein, partial [Gammaproteobacteria bacterium]|nr:PIN domain-containing protein [Gammaproteobacteria bacterium]
HTFTQLNIEIAHALRAGALPLHHRDPFDRMLIAQCQLEQLTLVTHDTKLSMYDIPLLEV